ncbi:hypothetical protein HYR99_37550 [Candidatus Poribacteria bacterium]|nr:hypothetical protein [Candidatus Poribacteria bacterium]
MSKLFDDISRLVAEQLPFWQTFGGIFSLLVGAVFANAEAGGNEGTSSGNAPEHCANNEPPINGAGDLQRMYADLVQWEREASVLVVSLDEQLRSRENDQPSLDQQMALLEGERELFTTDLPINQSLRALYVSATEGENGPENDPLLVRTALLHWTILLRRRSMQSFHTQVAGLEDDPDCRGDIIGDQFLLRYFDTLFEEREGTRREIDAARALADLARQSACLGAQQSAKLVSDLYWSFVELRGFLRLNGLEHLVPYVAQAAAGPLLLFYDVEKYRGPQSPLARWFNENYEWLVAGAETKRIPLHWHGLWLYDRRSGHLMGYRPTAEPADENDVHLATFFASITSRENLGKYDCSFVEMIERGPSLQGYLCAGSICAEAKKPGGASASREGRRSRGEPGLAGSYTAQLSTAGFSKEAVLSTLCQQPAGGRGGGGGAGRPCGNGVSGLGRNWVADTVRCLTQQVMRPGEKLMRCTAEAMGLCTNPVDKATKELQQTLFAGVRMGTRCRREEGAGNRNPPQEQAEKELKEKQKKGAGNRNPPQEQAEKELKEKQKKAEEAKREFEAKELAAEKAERKARDAKEAYEYSSGLIGTLASIISGVWDKVISALKETAELTEKAAARAREGADRAADDYGTASRELVRAVAQYYQATHREPCPPDTPDCGNNDCTAMSEAMRQVMHCFEQAALEEELERLRRQPGFSDPSPLDNPQAPAWLNCFESFDSVSREVEKQCWAYDCGPRNMTMLAEGKCGCGPALEGGEPGPALTGMCDKMYCAEGTPKVQNGMCTCAGGLSVGTGGPIPKGPYVTSSPRLFSEVRLRDMPTRGGAPPSDDSPLGVLPFR